MIGLALLVALLAPVSPGQSRTTVELGVGAGLGAVGGEAVWLARPWLGVAGFGLDVSLQAPLRVTLGDRKLRTRDWDEAADLGRVVRFVRVGEAVVVGSLVDLSLGHGSLVRRYHNGVDDDHHRVGIHAHLPPEKTGWPVGIEAFADQLLAPPLLGGRAWMSELNGRLELGGTLAMDTRQPRRLTGGQDASGWPNATLGPAFAAGLDVDWIPWPALPVDGRLVGDLNLLQTGLGLHAGLRLNLDLSEPWRLSLGAELILAGPGYDWAVFDTGWLIDRWRFAADEARDRLADGAVGGRLFAEARRGPLALGLEYADATGAGRRDLSLWAHAPFEVVQIRGFWRQRGDDRAPFDPTEALAAGSVLVPVSRFFSLGAHVARMWRVPVEGEAYAPVFELMVVVEASQQL